MFSLVQALSFLLLGLRCNADFYAVISESGRQISGWYERIDKCHIPIKIVQILDQVPDTLIKSAYQRINNDGRDAFQTYLLFVFSTVHWMYRAMICIDFRLDPKQAFVHKEQSNLFFYHQSSYILANGWNATRFSLTETDLVLAAHILGGFQQELKLLRNLRNCSCDSVMMCDDRQLL